MVVIDNAPINVMPPGGEAGRTLGICTKFLAPSGDIYHSSEPEGWDIWQILNHAFKSRDYRWPVIPWMRLGNHMESKQNGERNE